MPGSYAAITPVFPIKNNLYESLIVPIYLYKSLMAAIFLYGSRMWILLANTKRKRSTQMLLAKYCLQDIIFMK